MGIWARLKGIISGKTNAALDRLEDPGEMLEQSYQQMLTNLATARRALVDVTTARKRLEIQAAQLGTQADKLLAQAKAVLNQGNEELAREALSRRELIGSQLAELGRQRDQVASQETGIATTADNLAAQIAAFRTRKETLKATYTASKAQVQVNESMGGISAGANRAGETLARAQDKIAAMQARAAALDELMLSGALSAGEGHDDIDRQLEALSVSNTVETELAELRAELGSGSLGELEAGTETA
jgi:phage shock protein A